MESFDLGRKLKEILKHAEIGGVLECIMTSPIGKEIWEPENLGDVK
jgi:hypothetical protein